MFVACVPPHLISKLATRQSPWPKRFLGWAARIAGARVRVSGAAVRPHTLLIANHISWLDILVLGGVTGCRFVSKAELGHPLVHWLADQNHTLYVNRGDRRRAGEQVREIGAALAGERPITLFPEGTVGPGDELLPFRSTLLEAASLVGKEVEIRPLAIDYGPAATEISWFGENGKDNVLRVLGRRGTLPVTVRLLVPLRHGRGRKQLAREAREAIAAALAASSSTPTRL